MRVVPGYGPTDFASQAEAEYYDLLELELRAGEIKRFKIQPEATIHGNLKWNLDFYVVPIQGEAYYVDVKGHAFDRYKRNLQLWEEFKPAPLLVVTRYGPLRFRAIEQIGFPGEMAVLYYCRKRRGKK